MPASARRVLRCAALAFAAALLTTSGAPLATPLAAQTPAGDLRPETVEQLRQRIAESGLTPAQVRARLEAEGYPRALLDAFLPGGGAPDPRLRDSTVGALRSLGLVDSLDLAETPFLPLRRPARDSAAAPVDPADRVFGLDFFADGPNRFQPTAAGPVDPGYRLGAGDRLVLVISGEFDVTYELEINREGFVVVPQVGQVYVANLTLAQAEDVMLARLRRSFAGIRKGEGGTTRFALTVSRLRTVQVFVAGDVRRPGSYRLNAAATALSALYAAGGPTRDGSLRRIALRRGGKVVATLDAYEYLQGGDASRDLRLEQGDVLFVPVHGARVRVAGAVRRPATYELAGTESLADAVRLAGGFEAAADLRQLSVERILPPAERRAPGADRVVLSVPADGAATVPARDGDRVEVAAIASRVRGRVQVQGHVWRPGPVAVTPGLTVAAALRAAGGLRPDAYLGRVLVTRLRPDSTRVQLRAALRDTLGTVADDFALQDDDELTVFSLTEFRPQRYVAIAGAVRAGGRFPYREGMTLRDLVLLAGGLEESASLAEVEIARLPEQRAAGATAVTTRVPLDSTYLVERAADHRYAGPPGLPAAAGGAPEVPLAPYDNVVVFRQPDWELQRTVWVAGEVRYPGAYALRTKTERLSSVLARAGGLTSEAYPAGAYFHRRLGDVGRVAIDLGAALKGRDDPDNVVLADGDSLVVPRENPVVQIRGAVNSPSAISLRSGADLGFYVRAGGGATRRGDAARAYVVQPNGLVETVRPWPWWVPLPSRQPTPRGGAVVVVPEKDPLESVERQTRFQQVLAASGVLTQIAIIILTVRR